MNPLKALFAFYVNSSIHVAIAICALVGVTQLYLKLQLDWAFYVFIFLGTITGYNFVKYAKVAGLHHRSLAKSLKTIQVFSALCAIGLLLVAYQLPLKVIIYAASFGLLTFLYAVPIIAGINLRSVAGIKGFIVALVWTGITVIVPIIASEIPFSTEIAQLSCQRFILVIVWLLPFEIRDIKYDSLKLGTFPQRLGVNRTKALGVILLLVVLLIEIYSGDSEIWKISAVLLMLVITALLIINTKKLQSRYYASFWVEGIPIFWVLILKLFFKFSF